MLGQEHKPSKHLGANSHVSSFDGKIWLCDYVSKLYDSHRHIFPSEQFLLFAPQGDKQGKTLVGRWMHSNWVMTIVLLRMEE